MKTRSDFGDFLNENNLLGWGVELGVQKGAYSREILSKWKGEKMFMVDIWREISADIYDDIANVSKEIHLNNFKDTMNSMYEFGDRAVIIRSDGDSASKLFKDGSLDFTYIDANHSYESVKSDIATWYPKVKEGGYICGHDYGYGGDTVKRAVDEFAQSTGKNIIFCDDTVSWSSWFIKK